MISPAPSLLSIGARVACVLFGAVALALGCTTENTGSIDLFYSATPSVERPPPPMPMPMPRAPGCPHEADGCTPCTKDGDCDDSAKPRCDVASGICAQCLADKDCKDVSDRPRCDAPSARCVECLVDGDCSDGKHCKAGFVCH